LSEAKGIVLSEAKGIVLSEAKGDPGCSSLTEQALNLESG
jgi:hypothetical protein